VFGTAFLALTLVHLVGFLLRPGKTTLASIHRMAPGNLISAGLVFAAGWARGNATWLLWGGALVLQVAAPLLTRRFLCFEFNAAHFAERHGTVILIVLGESLVSVGLSARTTRVDLALMLGSLAGLAATAAMWWAYFVGEDRRAATAFEAAPAHRRVIQAI